VQGFVTTTFQEWYFLLQVLKCSCLAFFGYWCNTARKIWAYAACMFIFLNSIWFIIEQSDCIHFHCNAALETFSKTFIGHVLYSMFNTFGLLMHLYFYKYWKVHFFGKFSLKLDWSCIILCCNIYCWSPNAFVYECGMSSSKECNIHQLWWGH